MNIKQILKELEKQKDKIGFLKKILEKIKDKKLKEQIEEIIKKLEKEQSLEEKLTTNVPIKQVMQSLREEAFEIHEYKAPISAPREQIIIPRTPEDFEKDNIYKQKNSESYLAGQARNPIKARLTESYEVNHLESTISSEAKQQMTSKLKETMSESEMVRDITELEDKIPEYTTGIAQLEENPLHKKKKRDEYK